MATIIRVIKNVSFRFLQHIVLSIFLAFLLNYFAWSAYSSVFSSSPSIVSIFPIILAKFSYIKPLVSCISKLAFSIIVILFGSLYSLNIYLSFVPHCFFNMSIFVFCKSFMVYISFDILLIHLYAET